jgi:hypothetical protein
VPSLPHEGILEIFRNCPTLATDFLEKVLIQAIPTFTAVRVTEADASQLIAAERRADLVLLFDRDPDQPAFALVLESQFSEDDDKRRSWPLYIAALHSKHRCPVLLVVTVDAATARWARKPIPLGHPDFILTPLVIGPEDIPFVDEPDKSAPESAVLSVVAHARNLEDHVAIRVAKLTIEACGHLDDTRFSNHYDLVLVSLRDSARNALEELMKSGYRVQSEFVKKHRDAGRQEGRQEGRPEGREEGRQEGEAKAVVTFLEARKITVSDEARARILKTTDLGILDRWLQKAATVTSVDELFRD